MTWSEAKNKCGVGGSKNPNKVNIKPSQQPNHSKLAVAKLIAKNGPSEDEHVKNRQAARMARRDEMRQEGLDRERELKKEKARLEDMVSPHEMAIEKLKELESKVHKQIMNENGSPKFNTKVEKTEMNLICESKQLQLDEVLALDAIYADLDTLRVSESSQLEELQTKIDNWQLEDGDIMDLQKTIIEHPTIIYTLKRSIKDRDDDDWIAHMLLQVAYPPKYPLETTSPMLEIQWCLVTRHSLAVPSNKPLESMGVLDEGGLLKSIANEAQELFGMPVVYEVLDTWLSEHLFEFIQKNNE